MAKRLARGAMLTGIGAWSIVSPAADLPAKFSCENQTPAQAYDVSLSADGRCLRIDSHDVCEVQWLHKKWGKLDQSNLSAPIEPKPEFQDFKAVRSDEVLHDGSKRAFCRLKFSIMLGGRRVRCEYGEQFKDIAIICPGSDLWRFTELQTKNKRKSGN